jgi:hypothetical protein
MMSESEAQPDFRLAQLPEFPEPLVKALLKPEPLALHSLNESIPQSKNPESLT